MIKVERVMHSSRSRDAIVAYMADFAHAEQWDPGTLTCRPTDADAPLGVGTEWLNVSSFRGRRTELRYELTRMSDDRLTFVGRNKTATSTDDLHFEPHSGGTRITYRAQVEFHGIARLATPLLKREFERLGDEVSEQLPATLQQALDPSAPGPQQP
ncbi:MULTISPECIES: SRPBCC family protein [unclassified Streptomyces]|uniref:SRPBCC family protein n=1 Tax=unclassified Streptomyces TaxID=2593676 RepID=UPI00255425D9|nr:MULTISPECIES: SRPBCC family protein [unclassified Streptomyces]WRZ68919.1 SRPBCC family protein [Streptomyces sp. NBC_01257]